MIVIGDSLRSLVPEVALEYLRGIVRGDDAIQTIRLVPVRLWADFVQEIVCERPSGASRRRVFGFDPVRATLHVSRGEDRIVLRLAACEDRPAAPGGAAHPVCAAQRPADARLER